jgi:transcriptional regulator with XRE-family HTH domain
MATSQKKGVTPEQLQQLSKDLNLTVASIADGTGLSKAYISEFRSGTRNLSAPQQAQLRSYLDEQCQLKEAVFPEDDEDDKAGQQLVKGLGGMIQRVTRPAILLSDEIPKAQAEKLLNLIEGNRLKVRDILAGEFQSGGLFGGEFSDETEEAIRQTFALLALNYVAILMLQGRSIVRRLPDDYEPKTMGDWLSRYLADSPLAELLPGSQKRPALAAGDEE